MRTSRIFVFCLLLGACFASVHPHTAKADIALEDFYEALDPYGAWIEVPGYGYCWQPAEITPDWAPYTEGAWAYTDAGWTWVSSEPWGGICFHYGRWMRLRNAGWCWVPGLEWGPAWVSWRFSDQTIGWAPLPPEARFYPRTGISVWADTRFDIGPAHYNFCDVRHFGAPVLREVIYPRTHNITLIVNTVNVTNITYNTVNNVIYCGGPQYDFVESRSQRPIPALKLLRNTATPPLAGAPSRRDLRAGTELPRAQQRGNALEVFAPAVNAPANSAPIQPSRVVRTVEPQQVSRGWQGIDDPGARAHLRELIKKQGNGETPETAPAKPVQRRELKVVPQSLELTATPKPLPGAVLPNASGTPEGTRPAPAPTQQPPAPGVPASNLPAAGPEPAPQGHRAEVPGRSPGNRRPLIEPNTPSRLGVPASRPSATPIGIPGRQKNPPIGTVPPQSTKTPFPGTPQPPPITTPQTGVVAPDRLGKNPLVPEPRSGGNRLGAEIGQAVRVPGQSVPAQIEQTRPREIPRQRETGGSPELQRLPGTPRQQPEAARQVPETIRAREPMRAFRGTGPEPVRGREIQQTRPTPILGIPAQTPVVPESGTGGKSKRP
jgi:hypothetical protein